jgi:hypothetical protein
VKTANAVDIIKEIMAYYEKVVETNRYFIDDKKRIPKVSRPLRDFLRKADKIINKGETK